MARKTRAGRASRLRASGKDAAVDDGLDLGTDKLYFKIGEVSEIVGVPPYVLRYWETEFKAVRPQKSRTQQRVYRRRDVATLLRIKHLLYDKKFTIAGARQQLKEAPEDGELAPPSGLYRARQSLERVRGLFGEVMALLDADELEPAAADPAAYLDAVGGARAVLDGGEPSRSPVARPPRDPR